MSVFTSYVRSGIVMTDNELFAPIASTYVELALQVKKLIEQVLVLRNSAVNSSLSDSVEGENVSPTSFLALTINYRILPDLCRSVPTFKGRESRHAAED